MKDIGATTTFHIIINSLNNIHGLPVSKSHRLHYITPQSAVFCYNTQMEEGRVSNGDHVPSSNEFLLQELNSSPNSHSKETADDAEKKSVSLLCRVRSWNWRNIVSSALLWLGYLLISAAYSMINPFFPKEV